LTPKTAAQKTAASRAVSSKSFNPLPLPARLSTFRPSNHASRPSQVAVFDAEDGSTEDGGIACSTVQVIPGLGHCPSPSSLCHEHNSITYYDCQATFGPLIDEHSWEKFYYLVEGIYPDQ
jgi:hypothetical protein